MVYADLLTTNGQSLSSSNFPLSTGGAFKYPTVESQNRRWSKIVALGTVTIKITSPTTTVNDGSTKTDKTEITLNESTPLEGMFTYIELVSGANGVVCYREKQL